MYLGDRFGRARQGRTRQSGEVGGWTYHVIIIELVTRKPTRRQLHLELWLRRPGRLVMVGFFAPVLKLVLLVLPVVVVLALPWVVLLLLLLLWWWLLLASLLLVLLLQSCPPHAEVLLGKLVDTNV